MRGLVAGILKVDLELVEKASFGDKEAFSKLYYSCYKDLYNFALYTLGNPEDAADVVADVFVEIWKGIGKLRSPKAFAHWAFKILSIRCKTEIGEKIKRRGEFDFNELTETSAAGSENLEEDISEGTTLAQALSALDSEERMIIILSVIYGYTRREISKIIGKPQGTVASKLYRSYAKLRKLMAEK